MHDPDNPIQATRNPPRLVLASPSHPGRRRGLLVNPTATRTGFSSRWMPLDGGVNSVVSETIFDSRDYNFTEITGFEVTPIEVTPPTSIVKL